MGVESLYKTAAEHPGDLAAGKDENTVLTPGAGESVNLYLV